MEKRFQDCFIPKRVDSINETSAFREMLTDKSCPQNLGINENKYEQIYHDLRDHLAHRVAPKYGYRIVTLATDEGQELKYDVVKNAISKSNEPVLKDNNDFYIDFLGRDIEKISDWLIQKVNNDEFTAENLERAYSWLAPTNE
jgi:hypothetical protein